MTARLYTSSLHLAAVFSYYRDGFWSMLRVEHVFDVSHSEARALATDAVFAFSTLILLLSYSASFWVCTNELGVRVINS